MCWWWMWFRGAEDDKLGAVARVRRAAGELTAGGQPRRLLPSGPQRAGERAS